MRQRFFVFAVLLTVRSLAAGEANLADLAEQQSPTVESALLQSDVNAKQPDGMTALHWAVFHDNAALVEKLIDAKADVKAKNHYGVTPLSLACTNGNTAIVERLLASGADPNTVLEGGESVLMTAARTGKVGPVKALVKAGADVNDRERKKQTALMWAAAEGHAGVVNVLIDAGADPDATLSSGYSPLFFAVREGKRHAVKALLRSADDVNRIMKPKNSRGRSVKSGTSPLILAIENGHFELAVDLLLAGADPNDQQSGFSPLHTMTWVRKPNRGDGVDGVPSPIGSGNLNSLQFIEKLVEHGAKVDAPLKKDQRGGAQLFQKGATPFLLACETADVPMMKLLLKLGCDPHRTTNNKTTGLLAAAGLETNAPGEEAGTEPEALEALKLLLELGQDINAVNDRGETAMHAAAYKNFPKVMRFLADNGAKVDVWYTKNKRGLTPVLIAEGHRPGNFRPLAGILHMLHSLLKENGIEPPAPTPRKKKKGYGV
ncbi:ankyrin repeat domain-containing protein [bacterium]|nr:ankyrin repeat domain-containing protein [bacterium]